LYSCFAQDDSLFSGEKGILSGDTTAGGIFMAQKLELAQDLQLVREWYENKTTVTEMIHWVNGRLKKW